MEIKPLYLIILFCFIAIFGIIIYKKIDMVNEQLVLLTESRSGFLASLIEGSRSLKEKVIEQFQSHPISSLEKFIADNSENILKFQDFDNYDLKDLEKYFIITKIVVNRELDKTYYIPETIAASDIYYYIPKFGWTIDDGFLIKSKDLSKDSYYIPEGLIKIKKDTTYEWLNLGQVPVGQVPVGQAPVGQAPVADKEVIYYFLEYNKG